MKVKDLLEKANEEVVEEKAKKVVEKLKISLNNVDSAKKTLKVIEKKHNDLLETDVDDLELSKYDY